MESKIERLL